MAKSDYQEAQVLDGTLRTSAFVKPAGVYVALFTTVTDDTGGGTEVTGGGYTRIQHGPSDATWTDPAGTGVTANIGDIQFPDPTGDWGTVGWFALFDAATSGNMLYHGALVAPKIVNGGQGGPKFPDGNLSVTES